MNPRTLTTSSSNCPFGKCDGTGIILVEYPPNGYAKDYSYPHTVAHKCECSGKANADYRRSRAMLPPQYLNKHASDFNWGLYKCDTKSQQSIVSDFITNFTEYEQAGRGLYLTSKVKGSGKTLLASVVANELLERISMSIKFTTALDLLELIKKNYSSGDYTNDIQTFFEARLLIIDDLAVERKTEHTDVMLYKLVNERCNKRLVTIFTSNVAVDALKLDERTVDRINQMAIVIDIPNVPIRKNQAEEEKRKFLSRNIRIQTT